MTGREKNMAEPLAQFCTAICDDCRIRPTHISLYVALLDAWRLQSYNTPLRLTRDVVMKAAKVSSRATYNSALNELHEYGYVRYVPSADPRVKSEVWMIPLQAVPMEKRVAVFPWQSRPATVKKLVKTSERRKNDGAGK